MRDIDKIAAAMIHAFTSNGIFAGVEPLVHAYTEAAREKCETLRTDPAIFDIWPAFVVAGEQMNRFAPRLPARPVRSQVRNADTGLELMRAGTDLLIYITRARVPMPKSTREFVEKCNAFADRWAEPACPPARVA